VTSYLYVGVVWTNHKAAFRRIRCIDRRLHWCNLGVLFTTGLLPFPTAVIADALQRGNPADVRTAVGLYALIGALLCASWLLFYQYVSRHPELLEEEIEPGFFVHDRTRALVGLVLYIAAGAAGCLMAPAVALAVFLALPIFYGITSEGLEFLPAAGGRTR